MPDRIRADQLNDTSAERTDTTAERTDTTAERTDTTAERTEALRDASGGLGGPDAGATSVAGHVPVRTDDAVGASAEVRANARFVAPITAQTRAQAREIIGRYPRARSALLPMLHLVQSEQGYVTPDGIAMCAEVLGLTKAEVGAVATFYTMFKREPTGEYLLSVCTNTLCGFLGGEEIFTALSEHLGVSHDQTTADGQFTLEHAECLAACDYAPVVTVNYEFYDQQDVGTAMQLVEDLREGRRPHPTRGAPLCSFQEISRQLAGFFDPAADADAVNGPSAGEPTLVGAREALRRGAESPPFDPETPIAAVPPKEAPKPAEQASTPRPAEQASTPRPAEQASTPRPAEQAGTSRPAADPAPAGGQTAAKVFGDEAEERAGNQAEQAGAAAADPDAGPGSPRRNPEGTPTARRTGTHRAAATQQPDREV